MSNIIDQLELSVRSSNILRGMGVETLWEFLGVNKSEFLRRPHAGARSWREVEQVQKALQTSLSSPWDVFRNHIGAINNIMKENPSFRALLTSNGCLIAAQTVGDDADYRFRTETQ